MVKIYQHGCGQCMGMGKNMDVVATTEDVSNLHLLCVKSSIKPAPAASTGIVCSYAEEDMLFELITTHNV